MERNPLLGISAALVLGIAGLQPPLIADVLKKVDRFDNGSFSTFYDANPGECYRLNNIIKRKNYSLKCVIQATTFRNSYDRVTGISFFDSSFNEQSPNTNTQGESVYLLLTAADGTQKQMRLKVKAVESGTVQNGPAKGDNVLFVSAFELHDNLSKYLIDAKTLEFRFRSQEYMWKLNLSDVKKLLELSAPEKRPW